MEEIHVNGNTVLVTTPAYPGYRLYGFSAVQNTWDDITIDDYETLTLNPFMALLTRQTYSSLVNPVIFNAIDGI